MATTGLAPLPDLGELSYNGVTWNCLYKSSCSGAAQPDAANRTVRGVEWTITVDGIVTLEAGKTTTDDTMEELRRRLEAYGGVLTYSGKGLGKVVVNKPGGPLRDIAWGPKPKILEFQPLGGSRAAQVKWTVTTLIPELKIPPRSDTLEPGTGPVVQFNEETSVRYDEEAYSTISIKGTLEIPMTRDTIDTRTLDRTADDFRKRFMERVADGIDLTLFRIPVREFNVSRDKRTMEWSFVAEELPPMGLPPGATSARGRMSVRPLKPIGLISWVCSLNCTYTIRKDQPRRLAWAAFVSLLKFRMEQSVNGFVPAMNDRQGANQNPPPGRPAALFGVGRAGLAAFAAGKIALTAMQNHLQAQERARGKPTLEKAFLLTFGFDEGLYLDSKQMTFEASWRLTTSLSHILLATGVWRTAGIEGGAGKGPPGARLINNGNLWSQSIRDIVGSRSWLENKLDPAADVIVDMGS